MTVNIKRYDHSMRELWDVFVSSAKNSHFQFYRNYMEYHSDRFHDYSLLAFDSKGALISVLPANISGGLVTTHAGLSFGGFLFGNKITTIKALEIMDAYASVLKKDESVNKFLYKRMPDFYCAQSCQEDLYWLFRNEATLIRRDASSLINLNNRLPFNKNRIRSVKSGCKFGLSVVEDSPLSKFWPILNEVLASEHNTQAVHTIEEIELLQSRFPNNIRCFTANKNKSPLAGVVVYEQGKVAHAQYLANSAEGRDVGALDYLISKLIESTYKDYAYFDFGISTTEQGSNLNVGLVTHKEGFGSRCVTHDFFAIDL